MRRVWPIGSKNLWLAVLTRFIGRNRDALRRMEIVFSYTCASSEKARLMLESWFPQMTANERYAGLYGVSLIAGYYQYPRQDRNYEIGIVYQF